MKKHLLSICITLFISINLFGQLVQINQPIINDLPVKNTYGKITSRSATNPKSCKGDTSYFPNFGSTQYQTLSIGTGQSLGQFYGAPTEITVSGFRFYGFFIDIHRKGCFFSNHRFKLLLNSNPYYKPNALKRLMK